MLERTIFALPLFHYSCQRNETRRIQRNTNISNNFQFSIVRKLEINKEQKINKELSKTRDNFQPIFIIIIYVELAYYNPKYPNHLSLTIAMWMYFPPIFKFPKIASFQKNKDPQKSLLI